MSSGIAQPTGAAHAGSVLWQLHQKGAENVVLLSVRYSSEDVFKPPPGSGWAFGGVWHNGEFGVWKFHQHECSTILVNSVPLDRIALVAEFDVVRALARGRRRR